jgi:adenylate cyclase
LASDKTTKDPFTQRDMRTRVVMMVLGIVTHLIHGVSFALISQPELALINLASMMVFGVSIFLIRKGWPTTGVLIGFAEVGIHVPLFTILLGFYAGYYLYFFIMVAASFVAFPYKGVNRVLRFCMVSFVIVTMPILTEISKGVTPVFDLAAGEVAMVFYTIVANVFVALIGILAYFSFASTKAEAQVQFERERADNLLLNILPESIAERLKQDEKTIADHRQTVTVLFADIVGFTPLSQKLSTTQLVELLNKVFSQFDHRAVELGLEKIKTIGDAYMVAGGIPNADDNHPNAMIELGLFMVDTVEKIAEENKVDLRIRLGAHTGPVVAGVIGEVKFTYDLWGDTVNTASRMESHGEPGRIQITQDTKVLLNATTFEFEDRGYISVKGKGDVQTYFVSKK